MTSTLYAGVNKSRELHSTNISVVPCTANNKHRRPLSRITRGSECIKRREGKKGYATLTGSFDCQYRKLEIRSRQWVRSLDACWCARPHLRDPSPVNPQLSLVDAGSENTP